MAFIPVHPNCFLNRRMPIYTNQGWRPFDNINIGDLVLTHKKRFRKITNRIITLKRNPEVIKIWITLGINGYQKTQEITLTDNHPVLTTKGWKYANELTTKNVILYLGFCSKNKYDFVGKRIIKLEEKEVRGNKPLFNLTVDEDESYIAKGFLIHNCRCDWLPMVETIRYPKSFYTAAGLIAPAALKPTEKPTIKPTEKPKPISVGEELIQEL